VKKRKSEKETKTKKRKSKAAEEEEEEEEDVSKDPKEVTLDQQKLQEKEAVVLLSSCKKFSTCIIQIVIEKQLPLLEIQDNLEARLGAARTVHHIISELEIAILPWIVFFIIPIMGTVISPDK